MSRDRSEKKGEQHETAEQDEMVPAPAPKAVRLRSMTLIAPARVISGRAPQCEVEATAAGGMKLTRAVDDDGFAHVVVSAPGADDVLVPWHNVSSYRLHHETKTSGR